jgi:cell wall-associated NlpC family hydrolase
MACDDLVGIPFRYGGRGADGMDCWGVVVEAFRRLGLGIEDVPAYGEVLATDNNPVFDTERTACWHAVQPPYEPYDVLLFADGCCGAAATHCALWLGRGRMLHAIERLGVIVSPLRHFRKRLVGAYRHEGLQCHA